MFLIFLIWRITYYGLSSITPPTVQKAKLMGATHVINASKEDVLSTIKKLAIDGPDACIDAAGFRFPKELKHKVHLVIIAYSH